MGIIHWKVMAQKDRAEIERYRLEEITNGSNQAGKHQRKNDGVAGAKA